MNFKNLEKMLDDITITTTPNTLENKIRIFCGLKPKTEQKFKSVFGNISDLRWEDEIICD